MGSLKQVLQEILNAVEEKETRLYLNIQRNLMESELDAENILVTEEEIEEAYEQVDDELICYYQKSTGEYPRLSRETDAEQLV